MPPSAPEAPEPPAGAADSASEPPWPRVKEVFRGALQCAPEARGAFLAQTCGADHALRREVESLLAANEEAGVFLEVPVSVPAADDPALVGRRFGPYRVLAQIGRGGMGTVYRAVREDDAFRKEVALKLVRGAAGDLGPARFRRERQILARLQHPNIAVLHDGGTSDEGQPYLVMELVAGEPLDVFCASRRLGVRERVTLFRTVCAAVHYAHQSLVVHRDLKPGNILVTADGVPKLLDFGIAKLLAPDDGAEGGATATMLPALTPEIASPEQVRGEPITTASDVYSLGVVLYELLSGRRPYEFPTHAAEEIVRVVCTVEPRRPSTAARLGSPGTRAPGGPGDDPDSPTPPRELAGDLDTIVLKCLQKDPARRYASAQELSEDLRRYLEGLPVLARPDTVGYRAGKFVRRHRLGVAACAIAGLGLVSGTAVAWRQARIAEANHQEAERRFQDLRKLVGSLLFDLHDEIVNLPGSLKARQALVTKAEEYLETLSREAAGDRDLQRELAAAYQRLGDLQGGPRTANTGDSDASLRSYEKARVLREALGKVADAEARDVEALAALQFARGALLRARADTEGAGAAFGEAAALLEPLIAAGRTTEDLRSRLAGVYQRLSEVQARQDKSEAAEASTARAVDLAGAYAKDHPDDVVGRNNLAAAYYAHAERLADRNDLRAALARLATARVLQEGLRREQPLNTQHARALGFTVNALGTYRLRLGETAEAVRSYRQGVALAEEMVQADPRDHYARLAVGVSNRSLGSALVAAGDLARGVACLRRARSATGAVLREDPANGFAREELLATDYYLGRALVHSPRPAARAEGCAALRRTLAAWEQAQAAGPLPPDTAAALPELRNLASRCQP